jgi:hypothetical protein
MKTVIYIAIAQALLGAFDTLYYHEYQQQLPRSQKARRELRLHALRDFAYAIIFITFGWLEWRGWFGVLFALILVAEIIITITDFIEEDKTRKLPGGERAMHTFMAIVYGGLLSYLLPIVFSWWSNDTSGIVLVNYGILSWIMTVFAIAVFGSGIRDWIASNKLPIQS